MHRDEEGAPVLTPTEAKQAHSAGVIWVLLIGTALAVAAGFGLLMYFS